MTMFLLGVTTTISVGWLTLVGMAIYEHRKRRERDRLIRQALKKNFPSVYEQALRN